MIHRSDCLGAQTRLRLVLPETGDVANAPVVLLLHGASDDGSGWLRYTNAELYAYEKGAVLVIPQAVNSFYADMAYGANYFSYLTKELPQVCARFFGLCQKAEKTYVAGLSMGGYGALKCALRCPGRFRACAAFSAAIRPETLVTTDQWPLDGKAGQGIFGPDVARGILPPGDDLFCLAGQAAGRPLPQLTLFCGTQDALYPVNLEFEKKLSELAIPHTLTTAEADHAWRYWDKCLDRVMNLWF